MNQKTIIISDIKSKIKEKKIDENLDLNKLNFEDIKSIFKNTGQGKFNRYCQWNLEDFSISLYGWKNGKHDNENKTEVPPPEDCDLFFGDLLFIKSNLQGNILDFNIKDYNYFYDKAYGGFESLGSSDSESEEEDEINEYDSDDSFIDNSEQTIEIYNDNEEYKPDSSEEEESLSSSNSSNITSNTSNENDNSNE